MVDLGLQPDAFWALWPRRFALYCERYQARERRADRRAGEVVAMLYNINRDQDKDPTGARWDDFFPQVEPEQSDEQMLDAMMTWARVTAPRES